jgi:hypothetical protein
VGTSFHGKHIQKRVGGCLPAYVSIFHVELKLCNLQNTTPQAATVCVRMHATTSSAVQKNVQPMGCTKHHAHQLRPLAVLNRRAQPKQFGRKATITIHAGGPILISATQNNAVRWCWSVRLRQNRLNFRSPTVSSLHQVGVGDSNGSR